MAWILDTNVVSELRKAQAGKGNANVARWIEGIERTDLYISSITVMELEMGVLLMERKDATQGAILRRWIGTLVLPEFASRTLAFDTQAALRCAAMHVPDPRSWRDAAIAATALRHNMSVATRNTKDFEGMGIALLDPWEAPA